MIFFWCMEKIFIVGFVGPKMVPIIFHHMMSYDGGVASYDGKRPSYDGICPSYDGLGHHIPSYDVI